MRLEIEGISTRELKEYVRTAVEEACEPLRNELDTLRLSREVMSHREWAAHLGHSAKTVRRWIDQGLPASKVGRSLWIRRADMDTWLMQNRTISKAA